MAEPGPSSSQHRPSESASAWEAALLVRARQGDREAFGRLVEEALPRAVMLARGLVLRADLAQDLVQEACVRAFQARAQLDPGRPFWPWLYQVLRRLCLNALRDARTRASLLEAAPDALVRRAGGPDPAAAAMSAEEAGRCRAAIAALPPREREVLALREWQGLSYRDIADLLEIPLGTVMSRLWSARRRVAMDLGAERGAS